jgi:glycosyltransferase involved in cell wall biosynthesis
VSVSSSRPLRIVTVVHGYPPRAQAGAELCAHWLSKALLERGHDVGVFARTDDAALPELSMLREHVDGVPVTRLRTAPERATSLRATWVDERVRAAFERELAERAAAGRAADVVHVHHTLGLSIDLIEAARRAGAKVVATLHDFWYLCPRGQRFTPWGHLCTDIDLRRCSRCIAKKRARWAWNHVVAGARRPLLTLAGLPAYVAENLHVRALRRRMREIVARLNACDLVLAPSRFVLDEHVRLGLDPARARFVRNGVDGRFAATLPPRDAPAKPLRFGYLGSLLPSKGADLLVEAFQEIAPGSATLDLHGTSPWDGGAFARELESRNRHPGVRFRGAFAHERLAEVLAAIDVLVVPSRWFENSPVTLDEAALAEIPVVVAGHGGMAELLEQRRNGLAFSPGDAADLRAKLRRFVDEPALWQQLRRPAAPLPTPAAAAAEFEQLVRAL